MLEEGFQVALLDNFNDFYDPRIKWQNVRDLREQGPVTVFEADILDTNALAGAFSDIEPEVVVHLAAWAGVRPSLQKPQVYTDVNVTGTVNLLEKARQFGVRSFIFGSSSSVYGGNTKVPFSESDAVDRPVSPYAATKKAGELLCHTYSHNYGLNITCLRFFTVYGPRQRPEMAIHKFASLICSGASVPVFGDGTSRRDYTFVDDIVSGILAAIRVNHTFEVFNLGESETIALLELISLLEQALARKAHLQFFPEQAGDMKITYADITRARAALGYAPATRIEAGIGKFADWFLKQSARPEGSMPAR
jgi:UDP-glucuronate 4-epimerase